MLPMTMIIFGAFPALDSVGAGAGELIAEATLAIEMGCTARDLADTIHPHPTLSETVGFSDRAGKFFAVRLSIGVCVCVCVWLV